jgi:hypothetical protein
VVHLGSLDERIGDDDEGLLVLVGEWVNLPVESAELGVLDLDVARGLGASERARRG